MLHYKSFPKKQKQNVHSGMSKSCDTYMLGHTYKTKNLPYNCDLMKGNESDDGNTSF